MYRKLFDSNGIKVFEPTDGIAKTIRDRVNELRGDAHVFGLRANTAYPTDSDTIFYSNLEWLPESRVWENGESSGEKLGGVSAFCLGEKPSIADIKITIKNLLNEYPARQYLLVAGYGQIGGRDQGESVFDKAQVVGTFLSPRINERQLIEWAEQRYENKPKLLNKFLYELSLATGGQMTMQNIRKNCMGTVSFDGKFAGMRTAQDFAVYPMNGCSMLAKIQSVTRIGTIDLRSGIVQITPAVKGGARAGRMYLAKDGGTVSAEELLMLKAGIMATASGKAGSAGVYCDNSAALDVFGVAS